MFFDGFAKTHYCPTFKAEIYSLAAARAAIGIYRTEPVVEHIWRFGESLRQGLHDLCEETGVVAACTGPPFRMGFVFREKDPMQRQLKRTLLVQELLKGGIVTATGVMLPSYAHDDDSLRHTLSAFRHALETVAHAERRNSFHSSIEIPLL